MGADIAQILTIGGPSGIIAVVLYVIARAIVDNRREAREDRVAGITTETGIIDNTKRVMELVRGETDRLEKKNLQLEVEIAEIRKKAQDCEDEAAHQRRRADGLEEEFHRLERRLQDLEGRLGDDR